MDKQEIIIKIHELISDKLKLFNLRTSDADASFDLVKSGLLDSMAFVDLIATLEEAFNVEIDFEEASEDDKMTEIGGLAEIILKA